MKKIALICGIAATFAACDTASKIQKPSTKPTMSSTTNATMPAPDWAKNCNIYEVNVRQYTPEGTFAAFEKHIPRLQKMGVSVLWFMPIQPIGVKERKGSLGSYYSISDYKAVNPEFGTLADFKQVVATAHKAGMKVMIDWVANHTSFDNVWIDKHPDWFTQKDGKIVPPVDDWKDVADLNYDNKEMRAAQIEALQYWVNDCGLDGYRCDVAMMVPQDFWDNDVRPALDKTKNMLWLAEAEGPEFHTKAFHITYGWEWHHLFNGIAQGKNKVSELDAMYKLESEKYKIDNLRLQFTSNHDENSWNGSEYERMGAFVQPFAVLAATLPGVPLVYSGQEAALDRKLKFFDKDPIAWNGFKLGDFYSRLLHLKTRNKALWNGSYGGSFTRIPTNHDDVVYAFVREKDGHKVLVINNFSNTRLDVILSSHQLKGDYKELFTDMTKTFGTTGQVTLEPAKYMVFSHE